MTRILTVEKNDLRVLTPQEAIRRAQALVRKYVQEGRRLSDELIADRRRESAA